jgi:hypothetical protein
MEKLFYKLHRFFKGHYHLAVLDMDAGKRWMVRPEVSNIAYLKAENTQGRHILIQPAVQDCYLMADDIAVQLLHSHHQFDNGCWKPGRMIVETSPGNYQVWIHAKRALSLDEKRYWLKKMSSDPGADPYNRWGRCPGFRNRKQKYRNSSGQYPLAKLIWIDWKLQTDIPKINLPTPPTKPSPLSPLPLEGGVCHALKIHRDCYDRGDESATDFAYSLALLRRGASQEEVRNRLLEQRNDWKNHFGERRRDVYLKRTIQRAKSLINSTQK